MGWLSRLLGGGPSPQQAPALKLAEGKNGKPRWKQTVGESFRERAIAKAWFVAGGDPRKRLCVAELRLEPDNPHDRNAVAVFISGQHVAYLDRDMAAMFTEQGRALGYHRFICRSRIDRRYDEDDEVIWWSVWVSFDLPLRAAQSQG